MSKGCWRASLACALGVTTVAAFASPERGRPDRGRESVLRRFSNFSGTRRGEKQARTLEKPSASAGDAQPLSPKSDSGTTYSAIGRSLSLVPPGNDDCVDNVPISGPGPHPFDNTAATEEPGSPGHQRCALYGPEYLLIVKDVWYCWTASETGVVKLDTCGTDIDTKIAVYEGCNCQPTNDNLLTCNDDACDWSRAYESDVTFEALAGQSYLVRIGISPVISTEPGGAGWFTISPVDLPCDGGSGTVCQQPNQYGARVSDGSTAIVADDFTPAADHDITEVCWWGMYTDLIGDCKGREPEAFVIRYYEDDGERPGTLLAEFSQTASLPADRLNVTGPVATPNFVYDFFPEYEYRGTHAPVGVVADECYWIEISKPFTYCAWYWEMGGSDSGRALRNGDVVAWEQAFCLHMDVGDATQQCPLPSPCAGRTTDCCMNNLATGTVGCGNVDCCERVCACDPYCCAVAWDSSCAAAEFCSAAALCAAVCGACPEGMLDWAGSDPPDGVVDARQPRDVQDGSRLKGIRRITVAAPPNAADLTDCWDVCETAEEGAENYIRFVTDNEDGTFRTSLNRRITPGAVTTLTYLGATNGTDTGTFTSLPGDSNADGVSDSFDILALIECCLNATCVPTHGDYSCDIDHSSLATGEDLLRLIDLFNGAGAFTTAWYGATPDVGSPCP